MDKVVPAANGAFIIPARLCHRPACLLHQQPVVDEVGCDDHGLRHPSRDVVVIVVVIELIS
jgi:hypothetical protein